MTRTREPSAESSRLAGKPRHTREIAAGQPGLAAALRQAESYLALNRRLRDSLPPQMRGRVGVACIDQDCLVLAAATPELATRARLNAASILTAARQWWPTALKRSRIIVVPGLELELD